MAMGAAKGDAATLQVEMVCLDELVPEDDRYRRLDELVDWSFVREAAAPYYADELGRPSLDPIVLVKLMLAGALEGIGSVRELLRVAALRIDLRRFLGYGFDRLPVHQTISHAHIRRFVDARVEHVDPRHSVEVSPVLGHEGELKVARRRSDPRVMSLGWLPQRMSCCSHLVHETGPLVRQRTRWVHDDRGTDVRLEVRSTRLVVALCVSPAPQLRHGCKGEDDAFSNDVRCVAGGLGLAPGEPDKDVGVNHHV
ncbi:MAG: transposase [Thermoleophilaceae bacterium]